MDEDAPEEVVNTPLQASGIADADIDRLRDEPTIRHYLVQKYQKDASRNWDLFYKRNTTHFFKNRYWLTREFPELIPEGDAGPAETPDGGVTAQGTEDGPTKVLLEVGCGVGNTVFPLLDLYPRLYINCCDFSPRAVQFVKDNEDYNEQRCNAFRCDLTADKLTDNIAPGSVDCVTMLFVLSAISPEFFTVAVQNVATILKPGGLVLFRDYGLYDHAQLRFKPGHKLADSFYVRQDGTQVYYYTTEELQELFEKNGFETKQCVYIVKRTTNRKSGVDVPRIFVQGKFSLKTIPS